MNYYKNNLLATLNEEGITIESLAKNMEIKAKILEEITNHGKIGGRLIKKITVAVNEIAENDYAKQELFPQFYKKYRSNGQEN